MFIQYTKKNLHTLATHDGKELAHLKPGWNEFPTHIWEANKNDSEVKKMIADGSIVLMTEKVEEKVGRKKVTRVIGQDDKPVSLKDFDEVKAIAVVEKTFSREILQRWIDEETRHKVKRALEKQFEPFKTSPTSEAS